MVEGTGKIKAAKTTWIHFPNCLFHPLQAAEIAAMQLGKCLWTDEDKKENWKREPEVSSMCYGTEEW